jgi:DNA polymerase-3 subunit gamma/tau
MRELLEGALYAPTSGRFKVYIIDEVHMLSRSAFNAMLKTLEEPPSHVKFILATTDPQKVPVTVLSRCLQFNLKQIPLAQIRAQLEKVLNAEAIQFESPALTLLARAAQGSLRDALSLLDQAIAHGAGAVQEASVREMLGVVDQTYLFGLLRALARHDGRALLDQALAMQARALDLETCLQDLGTLLHRIALAQTVAEAVPEDEFERESVFELARAIAADDLQLYYQIAVHGRRDFSFAPDDIAAFTMPLLRMLAFAPAAAETIADHAPRHSPTVVASAIDPGPAPTPAAAPEWHALIDQLKLGGMARMLAQHCELQRHEGAVMELRVPDAHKHLVEQAYIDKLKAALEERLGKKLRLQVSVGATGGNTPAEREGAERQKNQADAVAAVERDPFVRELVENFDGRIVESSIKPVQQIGAEK